MDRISDPIQNFAWTERHTGDSLHIRSHSPVSRVPTLSFGATLKRATGHHCEEKVNRLMVVARSV